MVGVAAGRYHTVMYTRHEVYTCGLNIGQLGKQTWLAPYNNVKLYQTDLWRQV